MTKYEILTDALRGLRDISGNVFDYEDMDDTIDQVIREISIQNPLKKRANLAIIEYTKDIDISPLTYLDINRIEYPVDNNSPVIRNAELFGSNLTLDLSSVPTITDGTLTGTVTFTLNSRSVTGSGTLFTTELTSGDLICISTGTKYYQIAYVTSATALTLVEPYEEATATDTVSVTKYRDDDSCARLYYEGIYTVSTTSNMPTRYDEVAILGTIAHVATEYAANYAAIKLAGVTTLLASASTSASNVTARITQALTDLGTIRTNVETLLSSSNSYLANVETSLDAVDTKMAAGIALIPAIDAGFATALTDAETALDRIGTDLATAVTKVDTINRGGKIATEYIDMAKTSVQEAEQRIAKMRGYLEKVKEFNTQSSVYNEYVKSNVDNSRARLEKARSYLEQIKSNHEYTDIAIQNLTAADSYIKQSNEYIKQSEQSINVAQLLSSYRTWANQKWQEYQFALNSISRIKTKSYLGSRG